MDKLWNIIDIVVVVGFFLLALWMLIQDTPQIAGGLLGG
jgi:hypothetical protein